MQSGVPRNCDGLRWRQAVEVEGVGGGGGRRGTGVGFGPLLDDSEAVRELLARFDAGKARCYLDKDREKLLAVIEAGFGTFAPFNRIVRGIFAEKG